MYVELYSQPGCGPCVALKSAMKNAGVEFTEVDITTEDGASAGETLRDRGYQGTPVVIVYGEDGDIEMEWYGFRIGQVKELAEKHEAELSR